MSDEQTTRPAQPDFQYSKSLDMVEETMAKFLQTADVGAAYGIPVQVGETTIIPTAEVVSVMGIGVGEGGGNGPENMGGSGAGGGGGDDFGEGGGSDFGASGTAPRARQPATAGAGGKRGLDDDIPF
jgi:hypothetical protein